MTASKKLGMCSMSSVNFQFFTHSATACNLELKKIFILLWNRNFNQEPKNSEILFDYAYVAYCLKRILNFISYCGSS